jgi:hypothetical protein
MNKKSWFPLWIAVAIGLTVFIYGLANNPPARYSGKSSGTAVAQEVAPIAAQPSSGTATITQSEWHGVVCNEPGKLINVKILRNDVVWLIRLDKDDGRIHRLSPTSGHLALDKHNVQEWMIEPGQAVQQREVAWSFTKDPNR